ncbi:MAG: Gfo/Idh/MocA family oxidoreductase [Planctomycetes bacterium]|nr:Gfo/Idh/MocA family oxidoreductase [Planctomycetota bacterium]
MPETLKFGLIGAGSIAHAYKPAFDNLAQGRLAAVADVRPEAAQAFAEGLGCRGYASHLDLVEHEKIDAAVVCTPPASHPEICVALLERGIHVLCEKPLAIDSQGAQRMAEAARRGNALLSMASKFRFVDDVALGHSMVASGVLGEISLFENAFTARVDMSARWNSDPKVSGGGVLIDNGTHSVDILRYFLGPIQEVQVVEGKRLQGLAVEDTVRVFARSASNVLATIDLSWSINKELESFIDIYGTKGAARIGWAKSRYRRSTDREWVVFGSGYDKVGAFRKQIANFCNAIRGVEPLRVTVEDGLASVRVIEAAYRSLAGNNWVAVDNGGAR